MGTSKEELESRLDIEAKNADDRYTNYDGGVEESFRAAIRPLVTRIVELEDTLEDVRRELGADDGEGPVGAARRVRTEKDEILRGRGMAETTIVELRERIAGLEAAGQKEAHARARAEQLHSAAEGLIRDKDARIADLITERDTYRDERDDARAAASDIHRETDAIRAQVTALESICADHERRISEACADVREEERRGAKQLRIEHASTSCALERTIIQNARLETTVQELARMMGRREG